MAEYFEYREDPNEHPENYEPDRRPIADIGVGSAADTGIIGVGLSAAGIMVEADLDYERAGELRSMLADAMGHIGAAPHSGSPQMSCADAETLIVELQDALAELERQRDEVLALCRRTSRRDLTGYHESPCWPLDPAEVIGIYEGGAA